MATRFAPENGHCELLGRRRYIVFRVHDGKVTGIDTYLSNVDMVNAFFV